MTLDTLRRTQALTGLVLALFVAFHLATTLSALAGAPAYDAMLGRGRPVYQHPWVEPALLATLGVHLAAAVLRWVRFGGGGPLPLPTRLHRYAGRFLLVVIAGHVLATRSPDWFFGLTVDHTVPSFTLRHFGAVFYPYYLLLFTAGAVHGVLGLSLAARTLRRAPWPGLGPRGAMALTGAALVLGLASLLALGGVTRPVDLSRDPTWWNLAPESLRP